MDVVSAGAWFGRHVGDDAHGALWERDGDALGVEGLLDPQPQVTLYLPLGERIGLDHEPQGSRHSRPGSGCPARWDRQ